MQLPKYHETFLPILEVLSSNKPIHHKDLAIILRDKYYSNLPQNLLQQKTNTGANVLFDRIGWGKSYLKIGKFVDYPRRGFVEITQKGKLALKDKKLDLETLKNDFDFASHNKTKKAKKETDLEETSFEDLSPQDLIDSGFTNIEAKVKTELLEKLKEINPYYFEKIILVLLQKMGYGDFLETSKSKDGGIDGIINEDKLGLEKIYIQAKRYNENRVRETEIRNFIGAMSGDTTKGIFVTTSDFDERAVKKSQDAHHKIILINGLKLVELMYQYKVGVQVKTTYEIKEVDEDFFE
jgi:restriction system protein